MSPGIFLLTFAQKWIILTASPVEKGGKIEFIGQHKVEVDIHLPKHTWDVNYKVTATIALNKRVIVRLMRRKE